MMIILVLKLTRSNLNWVLLFDQWAELEKERVKLAKRDQKEANGLTTASIPTGASFLRRTPSSQRAELWIASTYR